MTALRGLNRGLVLLKIAILARFLTPSQFGIFGIAVLVLGFLEIMTEASVNVFLIQEKGDISKYISSAWVVSIIRGLIVAFLIVALTPFIVSFFNSPGSYLLLLLTSIVPVVRGFINPAVIKFQKNLEFNKEFYKESTLFIAETTLAVALGIFTRSELSLVIAMIFSAALEVLISFAFIKPTPKIAFELTRVKEIIDRGKWVTGAGIFNFAFHHLDDIVVGRLLGTTSLGLYQQAYKISTLPVSEVGEIFNKVTLPVFVEISNQKKRLKDAFLKTILVITFLVIPFGTILILFPRELILLVLGENWVEAESALQILAIFGVIKAISNFGFSLFLALKKQEIVTLITFVGILGLSVSILPLVRAYGIVGAGISTIIGILVSLPFTFYCLIKVFKDLPEK